MMVVFGKGMALCIISAALSIVLKRAWVSAFTGTRFPYGGCFPIRHKKKSEEPTPFSSDFIFISYRFPSKANLMIWLISSVTLAASAP